MPKILLIGTFCSLNKGDSAMQLSASRSLASAISDAEITVLTPFPDIDKQTYRDVRVRGSSRRRPFTALTLLVRAWLWRILSSMLRIDLKALIGSAELQEYARADVVVDLSGDTLTNDYGVASTVSHLVPILTAIALRRPVVVCAQSIGPLSAARPLARFALNRVSVVTAREEITSAYLDDLGVHRPQRELTADMAFLLEPARPERVSEIMVAEGLDRTDRPLVGIALSRLMGHRFSPRDPSAFEDMMAGMADHMAEQLQAFVVLVAHVTGPGERRDDRVVARAVRNKMRSADHTAVVEGDYLPDELKGVFSRFELFVGMRDACGHRCAVNVRPDHRHRLQPENPGDHAHGRPGAVGERHRPGHDIESDRPGRRAVGRSKQGPAGAGDAYGRGQAKRRAERAPHGPAHHDRRRPVGMKGR